MGCPSSKISQPNNPFELEQHKRAMYEKKHREFEKESEVKTVGTKSVEMIEKNLQNVEQNHSQMNYEARAKDRMQHQLAFDSESFILNQLMFSIQFFENFEK